MCRNEAGWCIDSNDGSGLGSRHPAKFDRSPAERDDCVTTHGAVAFVVEKKHAEMGLRRDGWEDQRTVHVLVAARLKHEHAAVAVPCGMRCTAAGEDVSPGRQRGRIEDDARGFAGGMHVDCLDAFAGNGADTVDGRSEKKIRDVRRHAEPQDKLDFGVARSRKNSAEARSASAIPTALNMVIAAGSRRRSSGCRSSVRRSQTLESCSTPDSSAGMRSPLSLRASSLSTNTWARLTSAGAISFLFGLRLPTRSTCVPG